MDVGNEFKGAVTLAFDAVDWQIGPYTIEPVWIDSPSDPDAAVAGGYPGGDPQLAQLSSRGLYGCSGCSTSSR
jgi:hypothetical protein